MDKTKQRRDIYICRRDNRVRSSLRAKQLFPTSSGGWMRPRFVTRICGETLASLCSLSFQATIYAQLFLDQLRYSFLPPRIPFTNEAVGFLAIATFRFFRSLVEYKLRNKGARDTIHDSFLLFCPRSADEYRERMKWNEMVKVGGVRGSSFESSNERRGE